MLELLHWGHETDQTKKDEIMTKFKAETVPKYFNAFCSVLGKQASGFLVGKKLSYADIYLANTVEAMDTYVPDVDMTKYPKMLEHRDKVYGLPGIKQWIEKRPKTFN